jgi:glycine cleavage system H protein
MYPSHLRYTKEHEWLEVSGETGTLGITDFAQNELGDIVYVELPEVGKQVNPGDTLGTIESVKAVSEVYAPVGGTVVEVNASLSDKPERVNSDPHGTGWICRLRLTDPGEAERLLDASAYGELVSA